MQLHEQTQRFILLLIFYLLGPILTLGIIGGIVLRKLPANARHWERTLTQQTGLLWKIGSVEFCSPGFIRLHKVRILDDTFQKSDAPPVPIFYAGQIDIRRITESSWDKIFPGISTVSGGKSPIGGGLTSIITGVLPSFRAEEPFWQITVPESILSFKDYSSEHSALTVQNMLRKVFARFESLADVPVQFVFNEFYLISAHSLKRGGGEVEADLFSLVQGNIYRTSAEIRSDWSFEIKGISEIDRLHLSFTLSLTDTLEIAFRTGRQRAIPCDLAAVFYPSFKSFSGGSFLGEYVLSTRSGHNAQTIRLNNAMFVNVPLAPLVSSYTDFAVAGTIANLQFTQAIFGAEGISAEGSFHVQDGVIESALFHRCVGNFGLKVEPESILDSEMRMIPFTASAILFRMHQNGIDFRADQRWFNALMYQESTTTDEPLWAAYFPPQRRTVTYHELMSIFVSDSAPTVPLTTGTQSLLPHIPTQ